MPPSFLPEQLKLGVSAGNCKPLKLDLLCKKNQSTTERQAQVLAPRPDVLRLHVPTCF